MGEILLFRFVSVRALLELFETCLHAGTEFLQVFATPRLREARLCTLGIASG
jgi:hypothetical protein